MPHRAQSYLYIKAWGIHMNRSPEYIADQQKLAAATNAPVDALYLGGGVWKRVVDLIPEKHGLRKKLDEMVKGL